MAAQPRAADPNRHTILEWMETLLAAHPDNINVREALVSTLADSGELERGQEVISTWPEEQHDARYWNLRGRWQLEYDHQPKEAVLSLEKALQETPQDWRTWYRLARALSSIRRNEESLKAAERVKRLRELLDPLSLGPRLDRLFEHQRTTGTLLELAKLAEQAGLLRLATAWRSELEAGSHED
jgi:thioredoxin-like negative regulator of GroEL